MKFVINSNRLMAALIKDASSRYVLFFPHFDFYAPDFLRDELEKYKDEVQKKSKLTSTQFEKIYCDAINRIHLVPVSLFQEKLAEAEKIMEKYDIKDSPFLAVYLVMKIDGIWSEDSHFSKQKICKIFSTHEMIRIIQTDNQK